MIPVLIVEKGDILTVIGGLVLVVIIALIANPQYISSLSPSSQPAIPVITPVPGMTPRETLIPIVIVTPEPVPTPRPILPDAPQYRIYYTDNPFSYPRFKMPENMETFGASEMIARNSQLVPFAYVEDIRGGLTQKFSVPYPLWVLNITVNATRNPQYGNFRMVLCYAGNGTVIDGAEVLNRGSTLRVIQTSNTDLYMIITTQYIDYYRIDLETPRSYYNQYRPL
jgi:hypothetical protein